MKFVIDKLKEKLASNPFGDNFVATQSPDKYNDGIARLNSVNPNQYSKLNTSSIQKISKTVNSSAAIDAGGTPPGAR